MKSLALVAVLASAAAAAPWSDTPAWPKAGDAVELIRIIGADQKNPKDPYGDGFGLPLRPVELVARMGSVTRHIALPPETGNLNSYNQIMCRTSAYPLDKGELGKLTFYEGGASGYVIRRGAADVLEIHAWSQTDGACESPTHQLVACPVEDKRVARLHVPASVKVTGGAILLTEHGKQVPVVCEKRD